MSERTTESAIVRLRNPLFARLKDARRRQIVEAAAIDPSRLSEQAQRSLACLAEWDSPATAGTAAESDRALCHGSVARPDAARARYDERRGVAR